MRRINSRYKSRLLYGDLSARREGAPKRFKLWNVVIVFARLRSKAETVTVLFGTEQKTRLGTTRWAGDLAAQLMMATSSVRNSNTSWGEGGI